MLNLTNQTAGNDQNNDEFGKGDSDTKKRKISPIKFIIAVMIVLILAIAGAYLLKNKYFAGPDVKIPKASDRTDSDFDGLPDKIERILGTNPNSWDTDGDGYGDLAEIKKGYDPLAADAGAGGKYSAEQWESVKEKIKGADSVFYNDFLGNSSNPNSKFSSPENTFEYFANAIKQKNQDSFFDALESDSLKISNSRGYYAGKISFSEIVKRLGLDSSDRIKYYLIDQNDKFALMAPAEREIGGKKGAINYDDMGVEKNIVIDQRGNIYLINKNGFWKIDALMSMEDAVYRNLNSSSAEGRSEVKKLRDYWMSGQIESHSN